jgi:hypothetical protein
MNNVLGTAPRASVPKRPFDVAGESRVSTEDGALVGP